MDCRARSISTPRPALSGAAVEPAEQQPVGADLLDRYRRVRARSLALVAPLSAEDQSAQSMPDASPSKWHLAHTTWFFETLVLGETDGYAPFDPAYAYLFNSYYEALGPRQPRAQRGLLTRPSAAEVVAYRRHVDDALEVRLAAGGLPEVMLARVVLGLAHEEQHQELLLTDILHLLAQNPMRPAYDAAAPRRAAPSVSSGRVAFGGGLVEIGVPVGDGLGAPFAFDNEGPRHRTFLEPFELSAALVTNADWLAFMAADGYARPEFWLSDGWATRQAEGWRAPLYWEQQGDSWSEYGLAGLQPLDGDAPVAHVSYYEADAFARWSGRRLPTEAEWELAAASSPASFEGLFGEVWQWTASPYIAYPGFAPSAGALAEYNGKFMVNQFVLRGSSYLTSPGHARPTYRTFFQPHQRWQATGVRLA